MMKQIVFICLKNRAKVSFCKHGFANYCLNEMKKLYKKSTQF
jgi:hypothetical protein